MCSSRQIKKGVLINVIVRVGVLMCKHMRENERKRKELKTYLCRYLVIKWKFSNLFLKFWWIFVTNIDTSDIIVSLRCCCLSTTWKQRQFQHNYIVMSTQFTSIHNKLNNSYSHQWLSSNLKIRYHINTNSSLQQKNQSISHHKNSNSV